MGPYKSPFPEFLSPRVPPIPPAHSIILSRPPPRFRRADWLFNLSITVLPGDAAMFDPRHGGTQVAAAMAELTALLSRSPHGVKPGVVPPRSVFLCLNWSRGLINSVA